MKASSSIARHVLQQLETVKVLEQDDDNGCVLMYNYYMLVLDLMYFVD